MRHYTATDSIVRYAAEALRDGNIHDARLYLWNAGCVSFAQHAQLEGAVLVANERHNANLRVEDVVWGWTAGDMTFIAI